MAITIFDDLLPIIITASTGGETTDEMHTFVEQMDAVYGRDQRIAFLSVIGTPDKSLTGELEPIGRWMRQNRERLQRLTIGTVFYARSPLFRFVLSALFLFQRLPYPYEVVSNLGAALDWLETRCREESLPFDRARIAAFLVTHTAVTHEELAS